MAEEYTPDSIIAQVHAMNFSADKKAASNYLEAFQKTPHAWSVSDALLHANHSREVSYFAANTLRIKIQNSYLELPADSREPFKSSLLSHLVNYTAAGYHEILVQLAVAVADLAVYMSEWHHPASELMAILAAHAVTLLDVLIALPEEIYNKSLKIDELRKKEFKHELSADSIAVFQFCEAALQSSGDVGIHVKTLKCLSSFLHFAGAGGTHFGSSFLLPACFQALGSDELAEFAGECICEAIYLSTMESNRATLRPIIVTQVIELRETYYALLKSADTDTVLVLTTIFTELADSFLEDMCDNPSDENLQFVKDVLAAASHQDVDVVQRTLRFWFRLAEVLDERSSADNDVRAFSFHSILTLITNKIHFSASCQVHPVVSTAI